MTRIAHLSDLHLLEDDHADRSGGARWRLAFLTFGRSTDPANRRVRALEALRRARDANADHLVLTGDLTEDGIESQFRVLGAVLADSGWEPHRVTLVPGNHDVYAGPSAWDNALAGPLAAYAETSGRGAVTELREAVIAPLSTARHQTVARAAGAIEPGALHAARRVAEETRRTNKACVFALHHPPLRHANGLVHWIDGLEQHAQVTEVLEEHDHAHVLHGHTHVGMDRSVRRGGPPRIFSADAVVTGAHPLRLYVARYGRLWPDFAPVPVTSPTLATAW